MRDPEGWRDPGQPLRRREGLGRLRYALMVAGIIAAAALIGVLVDLLTR